MKRITIDLDDAPEQGGTNVPPSLRTDDFAGRKGASETTVPSSQTTEDDAPPHQGSKPKTFGRSIADFLAEFINDPRVISTVLMFAPIVVFVKKINSVEDLGVPFLIGIVLNGVWFGVGYTRKKLSNNKGS